MKKYLLSLAFIVLFSHNILSKQYGLESNIHEYCVKHLNSGSIYYYIATPNKVLAQGKSDSTKSKNKHLMEVPYQAQTYQITRTMTVASIMLLKEQKKLSLDDSILQYIPAYYWPNNQPPYWASQAKIYHLLDSTSCIAAYRHGDSYVFDFDKAIDEETFKRKVLCYAAEQPIFYGEVGGMYTYSETNYFILGMIIEYVSKEKLSEFFRKNLFEPLGMKYTFLPIFGKHGKHLNTANTQRNANYFLAFGDGGVVASIEDIHKWNLGLHSMKILQKESYDQITKLHWGIDTCCQFSRCTLDMLAKLGRKELYNGCIDAYYGYGLYIIPLYTHVKEHLYCSEPESYWGEEMWFLPAKNISIVVLADIPNPENRKVMITNLRNKILYLIYKL